MAYAGCAVQVLARQDTMTRDFCDKLDTRKVAVERNEEIVPRSTYETIALESGDRLEIVHFIGGG